MSMGEVSRHTRTAWPLRALVVASIVLPLLVLACGSYLAWRATVIEATASLRRDLDVSVENATRVFDTQMLIATAVNDFVGGLDDATMIARESELSERIRSLIAHFPLVVGVAVIDADAHPLLAATHYPVDRSVTYGDRDYFLALRAENMPYFVGSLVTSRLGQQQAFPLARRKGNDPNRFDGVVLVAVSPAYFYGFNRALLGDGPDYVAGLTRADGAILARYPELVQSFLMARPGNMLLEAVKHDPIDGVVRGVSQSDGAERLIAYRRLADYPVYVSVGRLWSSVVAEWRDKMLTHLIFGVPATLGLVTLSLLALRHAKRESMTLDALRAEVSRRAVAEDTLRQSQKMDAVGRLTGGIAHDFNNHLLIISSNIQLLRRRLAQGSEQLLGLCDAALHGVQRSAALTQRLLAFSRQQPLDPQPLDAGELVAGMSGLLSSTLGENIAIETVLADELWLARCDANQLENAVLNLAVNARDAMPSGGTLTIKTANVHLPDETVPEAPYVMVAISDTGTGMTSDVIDKAFEPFFTTKPLGQGTGLGLSMVYGFCKQSGGQVRIGSEPGKGSTITMYLPRFVALGALPG